MKANKKEIVDTNFKEVENQEQTKGFTMAEICANCGHHGFCKYEETSQETLNSLSEKIKNLKLDEEDPFVLFVQCRGFCQVSDSSKEESK